MFDGPGRQWPRKLPVRPAPPPPRANPVKLGRYLLPQRSTDQGWAAQQLQSVMGAIDGRKILCPQAITAFSSPQVSLS